MYDTPITMHVNPLIVVETVVIRVTPSRGPREGGTTVTIVGDGLDLGQNTVVQFGDHNCSIVSRLVIGCIVIIM